MKPTLIVLEGHDRIGKDTLLDSIKRYNKDIYIYKQPTHEDTHVNCKNKTEYETWLKTYIRNQIDELKELSKEHKTIVMTRLYVTDNVFSDLFGREHIVEKNFKNEINEFFEVKHFCMLWDSYDDYIRRVNQCSDKLDYTKDEFNKIKSLYLQYIDDKDPLIFVSYNDSKEQIYEFFKSTILWDED